LSQVKNKKENKKLFLTKKEPIHLLSILIILIVGIAIYSNTLSALFHLDDYHTIVDNNLIKDFNNFIDLSYWIKIINNRPFSYFTFSLNYNFNGLDLTGYHIVNIIIHLCSGLSIYWFVLLLFSTPTLKLRNSKLFIKNIALITALIFITHPLQTQAVTYVVQRMTSMASFFYLLSICFYLKARIMHLQNKINSQVILYYLTSILIFVLAIMSKEIAFTLPVIIILVEIYFIRDNNNKISWKYLLIFSLVLISGIIFKLITTGLPRETYDISRFDYFITQLKVIVIYLKMIVLPINQKVFYDLALSQNLFNLSNLLSLFLIIIILLYGIHSYRKEKIISFCIFWFFITLSIESSIFPIRDLIFEHRIYLPLFGFAFLITYLIFNLFSKNSPQLILRIFYIIIILFSFLTFSRNGVWKTEESLWTDNINKTPANARVYYSRANAFARFGPIDKSINDYSMAIKLDPSKFSYYNDRGFAYNQLRLYDSAKNDFLHAIELNKELDAAYLNLGITYFHMNNFTETIQAFSKSIEINPNYSLPYLARGNTYAVIGKYEDAIADFTSVINMDSNYEDAFFNRGNVYNVTGRYILAINDLNKVLELNPKNIKAYKNRASAFYQIKDYDNAINDYNSFIMFNMKDGESYYFRAICLYNLKKYKAAFEDLNKAKENGFNFSENIYTIFKKKL